MARTHVELEEDVEYYANLLLPELARWRRERKSRFGDKSTCSDVFLNQLIPYLVEVLMQDCIYFVHDDRFRHRPFFQMIRVSASK